RSLFSSLLFLYSRRPPPRSPLFPYTTLFRSGRALEQRHHVEHGRPAACRGVAGQFVHGGDVGGRAGEADHVAAARVHAVPVLHPDRKSTRLNSSHDQISYAVFCLKKKKKNKQ